MQDEAHQSSSSQVIAIKKQLTLNVATREFMNVSKFGYWISSGVPPNAFRPCTNEKVTTVHHCLCYKSHRNMITVAFALPESPSQGDMTVRIQQLQQTGEAIK